MLVLFETPAGFALFKVLDEGKLDKVEVSGYCWRCFNF
jgi:nucleolar protein 58